MRCLIAAIVVVIALVPRPGRAAGCNDWVRTTIRATGSYVPAGQAYARPFVFAMTFDCNGTKEVVTVQRSTGNLPVCEAQQPVEVVGTLVWNKALVDGHYEINDPSSVTCLPVARAAPSQPKPPEAPAPVQAAPPARTAVPPVHAVAVGPSVWVGRLQDSRGAGDVTFTLVRGETMVSGTWKLRMGGGGPVTGLVESGGRRMQLRMENIASECPGTFEGVAEITGTTLAATYHGQDCEGEVTSGRLELRVQQK